MTLLVVPQGPMNKALEALLQLKPLEVVVQQVRFTQAPRQRGGAHIRKVIRATGKKE